MAEYYLYVEDFAGGIVGPFPTEEAGMSYGKKMYPDHYANRPAGNGYKFEVTEVPTPGNPKPEKVLGLFVDMQLCSTEIRQVVAALRDVPVGASCVLQRFEAALEEANNRMANYSFTSIEKD